MPSFVELRRALVMMAAVLLSFGCSFILRSAFNLGVDVSVLAVVLAMTFSRSKAADFKHTCIEAIGLVIVSVVVNQVGRLFVTHPNYADALFVFALSFAIYLRRWGTTFTRVGTVISLPFIAGLIAPLPVPPGAHFAYWGAVVALIAFFWANFARWAATRLRVIPAVAIEHPAVSKPASPANRRVSVSTSMALQMAVSLAIAFVIGRGLFGVHWTWVVLTAYIVASGNRGRGDVLYKGVMRLIGALIGTLGATLLSGVFGVGDVWAIVAIFVVIGVAAWWRTVNYAYWAGSVTAALAFLYGYFGQRGASYLDERLGGIVIGGLLAIGAAWFVLPVKTTDVLRRRSADVLKALHEFIVSVKDHGDVEATRAALASSNAALNQLRPPLHMWRRVGRGAGRHGGSADKVDALHDCVQATEHFQLPNDQWELVNSVLSNITQIRISIRDKTTPSLIATPDSGDEQLRRINDDLSVFGA